MHAQRPSTLQTSELASAVLKPVGMSKRKQSVLPGLKSRSFDSKLRAALPQQGADAATAAVPSAAAAVSLKIEAATTAVVAAVAASSSNSDNSTYASGSSN
jgi:hypothetical protein